MLKQICRLLALCRYSLRACETKVVVRGRGRGNYVWLGDGGALSGLWCWAQMVAVQIVVGPACGRLYDGAVALTCSSSSIIRRF